MFIPGSAAPDLEAEAAAEDAVPEPDAEAVIDIDAMLVAAADPEAEEDDPARETVPVGLVVASTVQVTLLGGI